jgi:PAS domain S-box-containing protein
MTRHAVVMADKDGVIRGWSSDAEVMFGHSTVAAMGQRLDLIVPEEYRAQHWGGFYAAVAAGRSDPDGTGTVPVLCRDGSVTPFLVHLTVLTDANGAGAGAVAVFIDAPAEAAAAYEGGATQS